MQMFVKFLIYKWNKKKHTLTDSKRKTYKLWWKKSSNKSDGDYLEKKYTHSHTFNLYTFQFSIFIYTIFSVS